MRKKLLYISIALPPKNDPECMQAGRYLKYLKKLENWDITGLTSSIPTLFMPYDPSLKNYLTDINIHTIRIFENRIVNKILGLVYPKYLLRPDSKMTFHWQWERAIRRINPPDIIYSRSFPLSSAIMALKLKKYYDIPWIMHLSDPWVESPLHGEEISADRYHAEMEKYCFEQANTISFTTHHMLNLYAKKYPLLESKFFVSPNVYDPEQINCGKKIRTTKKRIIYTGGLANTRNASLLLKCLDQLVHENQAIDQSLEVLFAGELDRKNRTIFDEYKHLNCIKHIGILSQKEAAELQKTADILLVIDSKISEPDKNVFFPSKLLDYMVQKTFILAITQKGSPTDDLITEELGITFSFEEQGELKSWLGNYSLGDIQTDVDVAINAEYSAKYQAERLSQKMLTLL